MTGRPEGGGRPAKAGGGGVTGAATAALFAAELSAVAGYAWLSFDPGRAPVRLVLFAVAAAMALAGLTAAASRLLARRTGLAADAIARDLVGRLSPLVLLGLVFIQFFVFLRDIRPVLPWAAAGGSLYLVTVYAAGLMRSCPPVAAPARTGPRFRTLWAVSFLVYAFLASGLVLPPQPFTGDEPHYLLTTMSLVEDGDINVADEYAGQSYRAFYPGPLENHAFQGRKGPGHEYSRHLPGVSVLVVPFYIAGERLGRAFAPGPGGADLRARILVFASRLPMGFLAALLGAAFYLLALRVTGRRGPSLLAWAVFAMTSPLLYYSQLIYPEVAVALVALLVVLRVVLAEGPGRRALLSAGAGMALLPWFGIKYITISVLLFALCVLSLPRAGGRRRAGLVPLSLAPAVSAVAYLAFFWALYGRLTPTAAYGEAVPTDHIAFISSGSPGLGEVLRFAFGYLFDQRFGIIPHSAAYILLFAGGLILWRANRRTLVPVLALFGAYWVQFAMVRIWGGYCPPGRLLLPVVWIPALLVAAAYSAASTRLRSAIVTGATGLAFAAAWAGIRDPRLLYNENIYTIMSGPGTYGKLLSSLRNSFVDPRMWVPSFANAEALRAPATFLWPIAVAGVILAFAGKKRDPARPARPFGPGVHAAVVAGLSVVLVGYAFFNVRTETRSPADARGIEVLFQDENTHGPEPDGFWTRGGRTATVLVRSPRPLSRLEVTLSSPVPGRTDLWAGMTATRVVRDERDEAPARLVIEAPVGFRLGGRYHYSLRLRDSAAFVPYKLDRRVGDDRSLGVRASVTGR